MKNALRTVLLLTLIGCTTLFAGMTYQEMLFVPWGENDNELRHTAYSGLHTGPLSFQIEEQGITIFDTENKALKTYDTNGMITSEDLSDPYVIDIARDGDALYYMTPRDIFKREKGTSIQIAHLDDPKDMYDGFKIYQGRISADHQTGAVVCEQGALKKTADNDIKVTRTLPGTVNIAIGTDLVTLNVSEVGSVGYIGSTPDRHHYIYVETLGDRGAYSVSRHIYLIDDEGKVLNVLHLPDQKYTYIFKEFAVSDEGELYHMQSSKDGIHILKWTYSADQETETDYPEAFTESYSFNDFMVEEPAMATAPVLNKAAGSVSRAEALAIGDEYVTHTWTATSSNIGTTSTVTTPSWIVVGQNTRVPYKWGGWSTIAQFDAGIANGLLAGDINTSVVDWGNSVGADCSGFVSVCWKTSQKYGTSTISGISSELSSYNDLLPADATNKAGSHIRMVTEWTTDGRLVQIEETASGTPGWAARYYTWRLSDITEYKPIRYNNIENSLAPRPTLLTVTSEATDSVTLTWSADESSVFTGYRVYGKTTGESFKVKAEVLKGVQTATLYQPDDYHYEYFVAAYIATDSTNYNASDVYGVKRSNAGKQILVVDGFDRTGGSYGLPAHVFGARTGFAMDHWGVNYDECANDAVINGAIDLKDYDMVWWICGDESTADETFNDIEQDSVEAYLEQGGKFFVSGSEIGWDLDYKGSATDKAFINDYLKTAYSADDAGIYTVVGQAATDFANISLNYSEDGSQPDTYAEDYPDVLAVAGGSEILLKYGNSQIAAVGFSGMFPNGTEAGKVMVMGFPFETITNINEKDSLAGAILQYMDMDISSSVSELIPQTVKLLQNYPNPFNPMTTIAYRLNEGANVDIRVFNMRGELVARVEQGYRESGEHRVIFNGTMLPSGMYVYGLEINGEIQEARKMILNK